MAVGRLTGLRELLHRRATVLAVTVGVVLMLLGASGLALMLLSRH